MTLEGPEVTGNVQHPHQPPLRILNGRSAAGEKGISLKEMLRAKHINGAALGKCSTNCIGSPLELVPTGAGVQRDLIGTAQEVGVTIALQHHSAGVGENHHAVGVADLLEEMLEHRLGMGHERAVALAGFGHDTHVGLATLDPGRVETGLPAALPGAQYVLVEQGFRELAPTKIQGSRFLKADGTCLHAKRNLHDRLLR